MLNTLLRGLVSHISIRAIQVETERVLTATADRSAHRPRTLPSDRVARSVFLSMASYPIPGILPALKPKGRSGRVNNNLVLLLEEERSIWVSQGGDCGYWPASEVEFVQSTNCSYRFIHWKQTVFDFQAGVFSRYFTR